MAAEPSRSIDIAKTGAQAPSSSAKPIIVTNKPQVADSTVNPEAVGQSTQPITSRGSAIIKPPEGTEERIAAEKGKDAGAGEGANSKTEKDENASNDANVVDAVAEGALKDRKDQEEDAEQQIAYKKVIEEKTYFVKINESATSSSASKILLTLLVAVFIVVIILNFLIDAEVFDVGVKSLTNVL